MASRVLALHLDGDRIGVAAAATTLRRVRLVDLFYADLKDTEARAGVADFIAAGHWDTVVAGLPATAAAFRFLDLPFRRRRQLSAAVGSALEEHVPLSLDDAAVAWDLTGPRSSPLLAAMAVREVIDDNARTLEQLGAASESLLWTPPLALAVYRQAAGPEATFTAIDIATNGATVGAFVDGRLVALRVIADCPDEVLLRNAAWSVATFEDATPSQRILVGGARGGQALEALAQKLPTHTLEALTGTCPLECETELSHPWQHAAPLLGLLMAATGGAGQPVVEFLTAGRLEAAGQWSSTARQLGPWLAAALLLAATATGLDLARLKTTHDQLAAQAHKIAADVLPPSAGTRGLRIKMEMREASLASRISQGSSAQQFQSPLAILADISRALPVGLEVELDSYFFNPPAVRIKGQAANFEAVTRLEQRLKDSGHFGKVEVADARAAAANGGVDFQVDLGLAPAPEKR
ncbi:MAG: PilN domain-containing protein [Deltaproteobacteria bacterium]